MTVTLNINFRRHQQSLWNSTRDCRYVVCVAHRRWGKSWYGVLCLVIGALTSSLRNWRGMYVAPTFTAAKRIAWPMVVDFCRMIPGVKFNEAELKVTFDNNATIQLLGAGDNFQQLRGQYCDGLVMDETALIPSAAWTQVLRAMLIDRMGWLLAIGTPMGRQNLFFELAEQAQQDTSGEWHYEFMPASVTDVIPKKELQRLKDQLSEAEFGQEFECSFNAAIQHAYFAREMNKAREQKRITSVKYDEAAPVYASLDLGWSDLMCVGFWQPVGTEHHLIRSDAYQETKISDLVNSWRELPFKIDGVILPHDAEVHELASGKSRREVFEDMGCETHIAPRVQSKHDGIERVRQLLPHVWIDEQANKMTIEALYGYRADYDEVKRVVKMTPRHSWESHYADMVQTYALGRPNSPNWVNFDQSKAARVRSKAWGLN